MIYQRRALLTLAAVVMSCLALQVVSAYESPEGEGDPVDAAGEAPRSAGAVLNSYHSDKLEADFLTEWMVLKQAGTTYTFWGARITDLEPTSPLNGLGVRPGDVITRLDGLRISDNMQRKNGVWQLPELERHFGKTEVRFIISGTSRVKVGMIDLDNTVSGGGATPVAP